MDAFSIAKKDCACVTSRDVPPLLRKQHWCGIVWTGLGYDRCCISVHMTLVLCPNRIGLLTWMNCILEQWFSNCGYRIHLWIMIQAWWFWWCKFFLFLRSYIWLGVCCQRTGKRMIPLFQCSSSPLSVLLQILSKCKLFLGGINVILLELGFSTTCRTLD